MSAQQTEQAAWRTWQDAEDRAERTWSDPSATAQQCWSACNEARAAKDQWTDAADWAIAQREAA